MDDDRTRIAVRSSAVSIGTELNQTYRIDSLLGVGGMGEVFRGHNIQTGDPVAIKIVLPEFAQDETILGLFRKEARILNHLYHDAIVRYHVFSIDPVISRPYLAMEFVDGPSLAAQVKNAPLSAPEFMPLLRRLADGLHRAHLAGVIHRDMSPDNVILPDGLAQNAKIIDFGIARSANVGGETLLGGSFAGKYNFVSPEQLGLFGGEVTPKSDVYSLALVMAAAMRGRPLDMSGSQLDVIEKRRSVPDLSGIPKQFHPVLSAMLAPDPAKRPADMAAIRDWPDIQPSSKQKPERPKPSAPRATDAAPPKASNALRNTIFVIAAIAVIGIGVLGGWIYTHGNLLTSGNTPVDRQADHKPPEGNDQDKAAEQAARHKDLENRLATARQDPVALQAFLDQCGADCPDDLAQKARQQIDTLKQQATRHQDLAAKLAAADQDPAALQAFLDQCGADCPDDLALKAREQIDALKQQSTRHQDLANQLKAAGQDVTALQGFLSQCGANCPDDLAQKARQQIDTLKQQATRHQDLANQLKAAGQDPAALQAFLSQCGANCPDDLSQKAREQINTLKQQATRHDNLANQLKAAGQDVTALQGFLDQCGADCPDDLAQKARQQINTLKQQATRHDNLANQLNAAGQDPAALQGFLDQCGVDCPDDLAQRAREQINALKQQATRHDKLARQLAAAGKNVPAVQRFVDQCGADCPDDLLTRAKAVIDKSKLPPVPSSSVAVLRDFVSGFGGDSCFAATGDAVTPTSASITALGTSAASQSFIEAFKQKAGFTPSVTLDPVFDPQCSFVSAIRQMSVPGAAPLKLALSQPEIRGSDPDSGKVGDPLTVSVTGAGDRNIYLFEMDHEGGIQNINRICASCITMKPGEMNAGLGLFVPVKAEGESRPAFFPVLVFAIASSKPLISINSQDAFKADDFITPFLKEIAGAKDVTTAVEFVKLRDP